jgi:hypothetical protein
MTDKEENNYLHAMVGSYMRSFAIETITHYLTSKGLDTSEITEEYLVEQLNKWKDG